MPIGVMNFQPETPQQANPGLNQLSQSLLRQQQMQQNRKNAMLMQFVQPEAQASLLKTQLGNQLTQATLPYAGPNAAANLQQTQLNNKWMDPKMAALIALQKQQTAQAGQETIADQIKNSLLPQSTQADIGLKNAQANFYNQGGKGAAFIQLQNNVKRNILAENPTLTPDQQEDAMNQVLLGKNTLSDGTPFKVTPTITGATGAYFMGTAPRAAINSAINSNQASKELDVLSDFTQKAIEPYAFTIGGVSPKALKDQFSSDPDTQKRLGDYKAATYLQYEGSAIQQQMAKAQNSVAATDLMLKNSLNYFDSHETVVNPGVRAQFSKRVKEQLNNMLKARQKVGVNAALASNSAAGYGGNSSSSGDSDPLGIR